MNEWGKLLRRNRRRIIAIILWVSALYGFALLISFVTSPSESESQLILGLSFIRSVIAGIFLLSILFYFGAAILLSGRHRDEFESRCRTLIMPRFAPIYTIFFTLSLLAGVVLLSLIPPAPVSLRFLEPFRMRMLFPLLWLFSSSVCLVILLRGMYTNQEHGDFLRKQDRILLITGIFLFTFFSYEHFAALIGWVNKTRYSYWNLLAGDFLKGRLYLLNPPANTHDLTQYNGRWYVPSPPVPAVIMMPLAYIFSAENISTMDFSIFFSAVNAVLLFLVLEQFIQKQWLNLSTSGTLWLVALAIFGTPHLWVGISGRFWFVSQILTIAFLALAVLGALHSWSPFLLGLWVGLAIGTRPNGLMTLPFVFAITLEIWKEKSGAVNIKRMVNWVFQASLPIGIIIIGLFLYNYARFKDFSDFGYVTISGDPLIVHNAQTYGLFSPQYILFNLKVMFLYLPKIDLNGPWVILPSSMGMSIFLTTPALVYLFHRYEKRIWVWGAWTSVFLNFLLLVMYHNTGRDQFGYRYILDVLTPLMLLLSAAVGRKLPWHFVMLVIVSVTINIYGAYWFMNG